MHKLSGGIKDLVLGLWIICRRFTASTWRFWHVICAAHKKWRLPHMSMLSAFQPFLTYRKDRKHNLRGRIPFILLQRLLGSVVVVGPVNVLSCCRGSQLCCISSLGSGLNLSLLYSVTLAHDMTKLLVMSLIWYMYLELLSFPYFWGHFSETINNYTP